MTGDLISTVRQMMDQTDLPQEIFLDAIQSALMQAAKRRYGSTESVSIELDPETGEICCYVPKKVVDIMHSFAREIPIEEARKIDPNVKVNDTIQVEADTGDFGRIEAQTARQVLVQKIKEAEREQVYEEYKGREGEIITGYVQRIDRNAIIVDLDRTEGILIDGEFNRNAGYRRGDSLKCIIVGVENDERGLQILLSRNHNDLVVQLFEMEVPEIEDGLVEIRAIARDPGDRSKVAVYTNDSSIDPVGTCVGIRGSRVRTIVDELDGEKIELIRWHEDIQTYIKNSLQPANVSHVNINAEEQSAEVIVPEDQLSLAIGRRGQNIRLSSRLTNWRLNVKGEAEAMEQMKKDVAQVFKSDLPDEDEE
ncbi:MAG: transcription termination factor NusA [Candidatus Poribacteria bacterium]|nr:transcription termination factor NusA [Candidatus Poribacteria bacterium]